MKMVKLDTLQEFLIKEDFIIWLEKNYPKLYHRLYREYCKKRVDDIRNRVKKDV